MSSSKQIILAITGGIAAYKAAILARLLIKSGHDVRVIMTAGAHAFITPLTLQALTGHEVHTELLDDTAERGMGHIELAKWAQLIVVVPASANTLARLACGMADDLLATVCLATAAPVILAPAMNQQMWQHRAVQKNLTTLKELGYHLIDPASGEQACGDVGSGRLPEPEDLHAHLFAWLSHQGTVDAMDGADANESERVLAGKQVVITAGPTVESVDPVRYLSNHSSGKMGFAVAAACKKAGASVILITGSTVNLPTPAGVTRIDVASAKDMLLACEQHIDEHTDVFIATAAVADYRIKNQALHKIKKTQDTMTLELVKNPDILATVSHAYTHLFTVGFAAETQDVASYAQNKLDKKALDMIACNDVSRSDIGFSSDDNALMVYFAAKYQRSSVALQKASKAHIAKQLVDLMAEALEHHTAKGEAKNS